MAEVGSAYMSIMPSAKGFGRSLESEVDGEVDGAGRGIGSKFGTAFKVGAAAVVGGAVIAGAFLKGAIGEAREAQKVGAQTNAVIKATGGAAGVTAKQVSSLAGAISQKVGIDDEAIQSGQNMLLTFKNIKNEAGAGNDIFNQTTKTLVDLSAAMGTEPKQAAIQLGKALNDPIKGVSALSRVGVTFTDGQKKVIESLVKGGKTAEAQKVILKELNSEFGGSAAAQATAGDKFKVAFGNLQETVGTALLPLLDTVLNSMTDVALMLTNNVGPAFKKVQTFVAPFITQFQGLFGGGAGGGVIDQIRSQFLPTIQAAGQYLTTQLLPPIMSVVNAFRYEFATILPIVQQVISGLIARIIPLIPQIKAALQQVVSTFASTLTLVATIIRTGTDIVKVMWEKFGQNFLNYLASTLKAVILVVRGALNIIQGVVKLVTSLIKGDWSGAWDAIKQIVQGVWQVIKGIVQAGVAQIKFLVSNLGVALKVIVAKAWDLVKAATSKGISAAVALAKAYPSLMVRAIRSGIVLMIGVGKDLIQGLVNGIKAQASAVLAALGGIVDSAISAVKKKLHIGSPSKLFHQIGGWTVEGFANGIIAGTPGAVAAAVSMATKVEAAILEKLTSTRDKTQSLVDDLKSQFSSLRDSVSSAFTGDLFSGADRFDLLSTLSNKATDLLQLKRAFKTLRGWGLDPSFLAQLFASGNTPLILDLASGSKGDAKTAVDLFGGIQSLGGQLGTSVAQANLGPELRRQTRELEQIKAAINRLPDKFGEKINNAVKHGQQKAA